MKCRCLQSNTTCGSIADASLDRAGRDCSKTARGPGANEKPGPFSFPVFQRPMLTTTGDENEPTPEPKPWPEAQAEIDDSPSIKRFDDDVDRPAIKLETRGLTQQSEFWKSRLIWAESVVAKLRNAGRHDLAEPLAHCHTEVMIAQCTNCAKVRRFYNRCELGHCAICQPRLSRERKQSVEWWTQQISQPKHVVLTVRNTAVLTKTYLHWFKSCWGKLRRSRFASSWNGGFYSIEITNEGKGWHVHLHALINAKWIDAIELSKRWAKLVGQDFAITKVKDVRQADYLREVTKYAVKGSELASWTGSDIAAYIEAMNGVRSFGVFGKLYAQRAEWRKFLDTLQAEKPACTCGCTTVKILSESEYAWDQETKAGHDKPFFQSSPASEPSWFN